MEQNRAFATGKIAPTLVKFALPMMAAFIIQQLYSATDLWMVGQYATTADTSAVSTSSIIIVIMTAVVTGFSTALTVLTGQFSGAGLKRDLTLVTGTAVIFFAVLALFFTGIMQCTINLVVELMKTPAEAVSATRAYLRICTGGLIFITGYNVTSAIMRGMGNSKMPLIFVIVACCINIAADYVCVKILKMGASGAAIATVASQAGSFIASLIYLKIKGLGYPLRLSDVRLRLEYVKQLLKIGAPIALQEFLVNLSFAIILSVINGISLAASAACGITEKVIVFCAMPAVSFSSAVSAFSSYNIGAGKPERAIRSAWIGVAVCLAFGLLVNICTTFAGSWLIGLFTPDPEVVRQGAMYIGIYAIDTFMLGFVFVMNGYFNSCGQSVFTMAHSLATTFLVRVPLTFYFGSMENTTMRHMGIPAPVSSLVSIIISLIFLFWLRKHPEKIKIAKEDVPERLEA